MRLMQKGDVLFIHNTLKFVKLYNEGFIFNTLHN